MSSTSRRQTPRPPPSLPMSSASRRQTPRPSPSVTISSTNRSQISAFSNEGMVVGVAAGTQGEETRKQGEGQAYAIEAQRPQGTLDPRTLEVYVDVWCFQLLVQEQSMVPPHYNFRFATSPLVMPLNTKQPPSLHKALSTSPITRRVTGTTDQIGSVKWQCSGFLTGLKKGHCKPYQVWPTELHFVLHDVPGLGAPRVIQHATST